MAGRGRPEESALLGVEKEVEQALIGRILRGKVAPPEIPPSRFKTPSHRIVWGAILDQHRHQEPTDAVSVMARLKQRGRLSSAGGAAYLSALETAAGPPESIPHYVSVIERAAARIAFGALGQQMQDFALQMGERTDESIRARYQSLVRRGDVLSRLAARNGTATSIETKPIYAITTEPLPHIPWVYEPWLAKGDLVVLAGEPGLGKSWLALDLMLALAMGRECLNTEAGPKQKVLYIDEENNPRLVRHRVHKLVDGLDIGLQDLDPASIQADYAIANGVNLDDAASLDLLRRKVDELRPDWIIFDSLVRIHRRDENSNSEMSALLGGIIRPLGRAVDAGVMVIHHLSKPSKDRPGEIGHRIRGASDIMGVADQVWGVERVEMGLRLSHIKCRMDRESGPVAFSIEDTHLGNGVRIDYSDAASETVSIDTVTEALRYAGKDGLGRPALCSAMKSAGIPNPDRQTSRALGTLFHTGRAAKRRDGRHMRYWLAEYAPTDAEVVGQSGDEAADNPD